MRRAFELLTILIWLSMAMVGAGIDAYRDVEAFGDRRAAGRGFALLDSDGGVRSGPWFEGDVPFRPSDELVVEPTEELNVTLVPGGALRSIDLGMGGGTTIQIVPGKRTGILITSGASTRGAVSIESNQRLSSGVPVSLGIRRDPFSITFDGVVAFTGPLGMVLPSAPVRISIEGGDARLLAVSRDGETDSLDDLPAADALYVAAARSSKSVLLVVGWILATRALTPALSLATRLTLLAPAALPLVASIAWDVPLLPLWIALGFLVGAARWIRRVARVEPSTNDVDGASTGGSILSVVAAITVIVLCVRQLREIGNSYAPSIEGGVNADLTEPFSHEAVRLLHGGDGWVIPGAWRDFALSATVRFEAESVLETRFHVADVDRAVGIALFHGNDPRVPTGFVDEAGEGFSRTGSWKWPLPNLTSQRIDLTVRDENFAVSVNGFEVAASQHRRPASGEIVLVAARGEVFVERLEITPIPRDGEIASAPRRLSSILAMGLLFLLSVPAARRAFRWPLSRGFDWVCGASIPFMLAWGGIASPSLDGRTGGYLLLLLGGLLFVAPLAARGIRSRGLAYVVVGGTLTLASWTGSLDVANGEAALAPRFGVLGWEGARIDDEMAFLTHSGLRRGNAWLARHRFHQRLHRVPKARGRQRVVVLGSDESSDLDQRSRWGYGYPALLEGLLGSEPSFDAEVDVVNASFHRATAPALYRMLRDVILPGTSRIGLEPDVVILALHPKRITALPGWDDEAYLHHITEGTHYHTLVERLIDRRALRNQAAIPPSPSSYVVGVKRFIELLGVHRIPLVLVKLPWSMSDPALPAGFDEIFAAAARSPLVRVVDAVDALTNQVGASSMIDDHVYSESGHVRLAAALLPDVVEVLR